MRLSVRESTGRGSPVLLLHGNSLSAALFHRQLDSPLGQKHHLIAVDLPGHGQSPDISGAYGLSELLAGLQGVVRALDQEPVVLAGHSLGGHLAIGLAARVSSVRGLFLFGTPPSRSLEDLQQAFYPHPALPLIFQSAWSEEQLDDLALALLPGIGADQTAVREALARTDPTFREALVTSSAAAYPNEPELLRAAGISVALVHGNADPWIRLAALKNQRLPALWRGSVQILDGAGHLPHLDHADSFNALLGEFIDSLEAP